MYNEIKKNMNNPQKLEKLFRSSPAQFNESFKRLYLEFPDSVILKVWFERLNFKEQLDASESYTKKKDLIYIIVLSLISGLFSKLPSIFKGLNKDFFFHRNTAFFIFPALTIYFIQRNEKRNRRLSIMIYILIILSLIFINILPETDKSQTLILSCVHIPFILWVFLGIAFIQDKYFSTKERIRYLKYNGELLIYTALILIGGMILIFIGMSLFSAIKISIETFYLNYIVVFGCVASPIVATYIVTNISKNKLNIAPIISKIFSPLFLITFSSYLLIMLITGKSPFTDRDFLITYNIMLAIVLAISIFVISDGIDNNKSKPIGYPNIFLILVVLILDLIALSAIIYRLSNYGMSPNRIAVLGANLLIMFNLSGILYIYLRYLRDADLNIKLLTWIGNYLSVYTIWTIIVVFLFPFIFMFK